MGPYQHVVTRIDSSDDPGSLVYNSLSARLSRSNSTQLQIYQQRAWLFFDDTRLYLPRISGRPRFPSQNFLCQEADRWVSRGGGGLVENSELIRSQRRSQKWQDEYATIETKRADDKTIRELRENYSTLRHEFEALQQAMSGNSELSVPVLEEPEVLREEAEKMIEQHTACDLATVAKYVRYLPLASCIVCRQPHHTATIPASSRLFAGKTLAEIELFLDLYLRVLDEDGTLDLEEPIDFCFGLG
ncbi:hypothetical protein FNYG_07124 [Fusarium nygamai]|uniref:Uncharacterized protein n=1 Tax=Gibberella nygamai TaxID=42673 RepID=A0A2K0WB56_GIBNY|nr:hypothetical protein FNYG_07124 [Fusarium nygamai]